MAGASGLADILLAALIAFVLVVVAVALLVYGLVAKNARRGFRASVVALVLSSIAALLSTPFWMIVITGRDTHGDPLRYPESWPLAAVVILETLAIAMALVAVIRQGRRRKQMVQ